MGEQQYESKRKALWLQRPIQLYLDLYIIAPTFFEAVSAAFSYFSGTACGIIAEGSVCLIADKILLCTIHVHVCACFARVQCSVKQHSCQFVLNVDVNLHVQCSLPKASKSGCFI